MKRKKIMTWTLTWLNVSVAALNATFQLLVIYRLVVGPHNVWDNINFCSVKGLVLISIIQQNNQYREFASCDIFFFHINYFECLYENMYDYSY